MPAGSPVCAPSFREAFLFWLKLGFISFGGPAGQIALMHTELVERRKWVEEGRFTHALNFCMLLPGPEAIQLAIYIGWLLHRVRGGIVAGVLFLLPSVVILWLLSWVYVVYGNAPALVGVFYGLKPAVMAIVAAAVWRIGLRALKTPAMWMLALLSLGLMVQTFWRVPFPFVILGAGIIGFLGVKRWPGLFPAATGGHGAPAAKEKAHETGGVDEAERGGLSSELGASGGTFASAMRGTQIAAGVVIALWFLPVLLAFILEGPAGTLFSQGLFFSKAALVTFGGAYAVLPYVAQQAVEKYQWLAPGQMLDGMALAETTPGPLIIVLQFVGFLGAWHHPGALPPFLAATLGAAMTTWCTFAPSFALIFLGAPYVERLRGNKAVSAALAAITAAVVGVIANLAIWFGVHVLWPSAGHLDWFALTLGLVSVIGLVRFKWGVIPLILASGFLGLLWKSFAG